MCHKYSPRSNRKSILLIQCTKFFALSLCLSLDNAFFKQTNLIPNFPIIFISFQRLLVIEWSDEKNIVQRELEEILNKTVSLCKLSDEQHRGLNQRIIEFFEALKTPWAIKQRSNEQDIDAIDQEESCDIEDIAAKEKSSWQNVNVAWLADPKQFQSAFLPVMKVCSDRPCLPLNLRGF